MLKEHIIKNIVYDFFTYVCFLQKTNMDITFSTQDFEFEPLDFLLIDDNNFNVDDLFSVDKFQEDNISSFASDVNEEVLNIKNQSFISISNVELKHQSIASSISSLTQYINEDTSTSTVQTNNQGDILSEEEKKLNDFDKLKIIENYLILQGDDSFMRLKLDGYYSSNIKIDQYTLISKCDQIKLQNKIWVISHSGEIINQKTKHSLKYAIYPRKKDRELVHLNSCLLDNRNSNLEYKHKKKDCYYINDKTHHDYYGVAKIADNEYKTFFYFPQKLTLYLKKSSDPKECALEYDSFIVRNDLKGYYLNFAEDHLDYLSKCDQSKNKNIINILSKRQCKNHIELYLSNHEQIIVDYYIYKQIKSCKLLYLDKIFYVCMKKVYKKLTRFVLGKTLPTNMKCTHINGNINDFRYKNLEI